jgi:hypothetical protein
MTHVQICSKHYKYCNFSLRNISLLLAFVIKTKSYFISNSDIYGINTPVINSLEVRLVTICHHMSKCNLMIL